MTDPIGDDSRMFWTDAEVVSDLSADMLLKLRHNKQKAHWSTVSNDWLLTRLKEEVSELECALESGEGIVYECADVANFAAMIADNVRRADK